MRKSPQDSPFNKALRAYIEGTTPDERVLFVDNDNKIREAIYASEFHTGILQRERQRLEDAGVLKAVVHVSAVVFGSSAGGGTRTTVVEYIPDGQHYEYSYTPAVLHWKSVNQDSVAEIQKLFGERGEPGET